MSEPVRARRLAHEEGRKLQQLVRVRRALIDEAFIVATATARPSTLGRPFTCWSPRELADHLATDAARQLAVDRERLRQILRRKEVSRQRTRTWKESEDPDLDAELDRKVESWGRPRTKAA